MIEFFFFCSSFGRRCRIRRRRPSSNLNLPQTSSTSSFSFSFSTPPPPPPSPGIVARLPHWLAPNLITLSGLALLVLAYLGTVFQCLDMRGDGAPRWVFAGMGLATLAYLHLDCLDGKQARRTASASPLGQLFDHGCDALCVHLLLVGIAPTLDVGFVPWSYGGQLAVAGPWLAAHWEEYHCGEMLYGNGFWGVTEANYTLVALHFVSAIFGPAMWSRNVVDVAPASLVRAAEKGLALLLRPYAFFASKRGAAVVAGKGLLLKPLTLALGRLGLSTSTQTSSLALASSFLSSLRINDLLLACIGGCGVLQITTQLWRVYALDSGKRLPRNERGNKELGLRAATKHLAQLALVVLVGVVSMGKNFYFFVSLSVSLGARRRRKEKKRKREKKNSLKKKKNPEKISKNRRAPPSPGPLRAPLPRRLRRLRPGLRPGSHQADHGPHEQGALRGGLVAAGAAVRRRGAFRPQPGPRERRKHFLSSFRDQPRRRRRFQPLGDLGRLPPLRHGRDPRDVRVPRDPLPDDRRRES